MIIMVYGHIAHRPFLFYDRHAGKSYEKFIIIIIISSILPVTLAVWGAAAKYIRGKPWRR